MPTLRPYTERLRKANVYRGLCQQHIEMLLIIESEPLPVPDRKQIKDYNLPSPTPIKGHSLGPIVAQHLVKMQERDGNKLYVLTDTGREYIAQLRAAGMIEELEQTTTQL